MPTSPEHFHFLKNTTKLRVGERNESQERGNQSFYQRKDLPVLITIICQDLRKMINQTHSSSGPKQKLGYAGLGWCPRKRKKTWGLLRVKG